MEQVFHLWTTASQEPLSLTGSGEVSRVPLFLLRPMVSRNKQRWRGRAEGLTCGSSDFLCSRNGLCLPSPHPIGCCFGPQF